MPHSPRSPESSSSLGSLPLPNPVSPPISPAPGVLVDPPQPALVPPMSRQAKLRRAFHSEEWGVLREALEDLRRDTVEQMVAVSDTSEVPKLQAGIRLIDWLMSDWEAHACPARTEVPVRRGYMTTDRWEG